MSKANDIFGGDIPLDENRRAVVAANGELVWCDGIAAAVQDIRLRVYTALGGLFYDRLFGSAIPDFIHDENTKSNRLSLNAEVRRRLELDARVLSGSVSSKILRWDESGIVIEASWLFHDTPEPQNMTVTLSRPGHNQLPEDINLGDDN
jgi:phage baseplate assembly protein W